MRSIIAGLLILILIILVLALSSCYTRPVATKQFGRAAITYPDIPADYCARTYPVVPKYIKGDSVIVFDTLWGEGEIINDTLIVMDTVRITKVVNLPGKIITKTVTRLDTLRVIDNAALDLCGIERLRALQIATDYKLERDTYKKSRNKWRGYAISSWAVIALGLFAFFYRKFKKTIPIPIK